MTAASFDVLVVGSTPLARLLAGLLANAHGKRVVLVGDSHAAFRLPRALDLSVAPITRPETWALLAQSVPETRKLLARLGAKTCVRRIDPILLAATPASRDALAHLRGSATAFGIALEPLAAKSSQGEGLLIRDALLLLAAPLEKILDNWLDRSGTVRIPTDSMKVTIAADGGALVEGPEMRIDAAHTVLADDAAVLTHSAVPALIRCSASTILTEPTAPVAAPIMLQLDGGLNLVQHGDGGIAAMGPGDVQHLAQQLGTLLGDRHLRRAGQSRYDVARSPDGAPVIGRANGNGPTIVAGLGATGAFLAPALARWLADAATPDEARYFSAHSPDRSMLTSGVADYSGQWETMT